MDHRDIHDSFLAAIISHPLLIVTQAWHTVISRSFVLGRGLDWARNCGGQVRSTISTTVKVVNDADARRAYDNGDWNLAANLWLEIASKSHETLMGDAFFNAACSLSLDGQHDRAIDTLKRAIDSGMYRIERLEEDADLAPLRGYDRWPPLMDTARQRFADWEAKLNNPALRRELLALAAEDQAARRAWIDAPDKYDATMDALDLRTAARLKLIVQQFGWPTHDMVGPAAAEAAWLIAQHADHDLTFQKECLTMLELAVQQGQAAPRNYAYLLDRIAVASGAEQVYGTQFDDDLVPAPIFDESHVDERRESVGLGSLAEYRAAMEKIYRPPK
jgi:hypothetical protein